MEIRNRIQWMDALKLFAIFLVLWGHAVQHLLSSEPATEPVYRFIYAFHMPLFMIISGFFGARLSEQSFVHGVIKRTRQLLLPSVFYGVILCILTHCFNLEGGGLRFIYRMLLVFEKFIYLLLCLFACSSFREKTVVFLDIDDSNVKSRYFNLSNI